VAEEFTEIVRRVNEEHLAFSEAECQVLGFSHQEIGAKIGEMWKLPEPIIQCIRYHHEPESLEPANTLVDVVYLANCICLLLGIGLGEDGLYHRASEEVVRRNSLRESDLEVIGATTLTDLKRVEQLFADADAGRRPTMAART
ncbi:MAG TPA: HDOD domain-containing protein, partial [Phycisphaerae bacterium]|nr:HDOD domain-containing protein [Phycisphaerae bacterium]